MRAHVAISGTTLENAAATAIVCPVTFWHAALEHSKLGEKTALSTAAIRVFVSARPNSGNGVVPLTPNGRGGKASGEATTGEGEGGTGEGLVVGEGFPGDGKLGGGLAGGGNFGGCDGGGEMGGGDTWLVMLS